MIIQAIVAHDSKFGIGKAGSIPWHVPGDLKQFQEKTAGCSIIMGRKTWDSLPTKPLPNRLSIVITRQPDFYPRSFIVYAAQSPLEALRLAIQKRYPIFIIGGGGVYDDLLPYTNIFHVTQVDGDFGCDTHISTYSNLFLPEIIGETQISKKGISYRFCKYVNPTFKTL